MNLRSFIKYICISGALFISCQKEDSHFSSTSDETIETTILNDGNNQGPNDFTPSLSYGDTIFYLSATSANIISPLNDMGKGKYICFPGGLEIDSLTGNINIAESEGGLRYKVMFVPENSTDTSMVKIVISGINFYDQIFNLSKGDSMANAIYNANGLPFATGRFGTGKNSIFDEGNGCNKQGFAVSTSNGHINLAQSIRNGALGNKNGAVKEIVYYYRMDDSSNKVLNKLKVKLYLYNTTQDIPSYLWDIILKERAGTIIPALNSSSGLRARRASPRPPCLIIVMN